MIHYRCYQCMISIIFLLYVSTVAEFNRSSSLSMMENHIDDDHSNQDCFDIELKASQDCSNQDLMYFDVEYHGSGFGSQFNHYVIHALINAVVSNRRLVHVNLVHNWFYSCDRDHTWSCYLDFPCSDSVLMNSSHMILANNSRNTLHIRRAHGHNREQIKNKISRAYDKYYQLNNGNRSCAMASLTITSITSIAAKHLFRLNNATSSKVNAMNRVYGLDPYSYLAVQIRTTDKRLEVDQDTWDFITNTTRVADTMVRYMTEYNTSDVYIASDDCRLINIYKIALLAWSSRVMVHSSCTSDVVMSGNPRANSGYNDTMKLISDIVMLQHGKAFLGLVESNLVRMIYRLRYPDHQSTFFPIYLSAAQQKNTNVALYNLLS